MAALGKPAISKAERLMKKMQKDFSEDLSTRKRAKSTIDVNTQQLTLFAE